MFCNIFIVCPTPTSRKKGRPKHTAEEKEQAAAAKRCKKEEMAAEKWWEKNQKVDE